MIHGRTVIQSISESVKRAKSKADLKTEFETGLRRITDEAGWELSFLSDSEQTLIEAGRNDALLCRLVIEYEQPGKLQISKEDAGNREHIERLISYIHSHAESQERLVAGAVTDGRQILLLEPRRGKRIAVDPRPVSQDSIGTLLNLAQALNRKKLAADGLIRDFGPESDLARRGITTLLTRVIDAPHPKTTMMFREWDRLFGIIHGEGIQKEKEKSKILAKTYHIDKRIPLRPLLFSVFTYCALLTKLLAAEFLSWMKNCSSFAEDLMGLDDILLRDKLEALEDGEYFSSCGVKNFTKGNLFSWYVDAWSSDCADMVKGLCENLKDYEPSTVSVLPHETLQLLKTFQRHLIPQKLRLDLGEEFTPDWLAERLLNMVGYDGNPDKRILDPCCGSGTFLMHIIDRLHQFMDDHFGRYPNKTTVLDKIIRNIVGFDLNPLSVVTARTNYLFALGDLIRAGDNDIHIPVYLADAVRVPTEQIELFLEGYFLQTAAGNISLPAEIVESENVPTVASLLNEGLRLQSGVDIFLERTKRSCKLDDETYDRAKPGLVHLYRTMLSLDREGKNRFWTGVIENAFAPLIIDTFDFIVGSPPWGSWDNMNSAYRKETLPLWLKYELQAKSGGVHFELGKQKRDAALIFSFVSIDSYLKKRGRLAYVFPKSVLKDEGGEAFRRFQLDANTPIKVVHVDDFEELQPIEDTTMKPCVIVLQKGAPTNYPVPYTLWRPKDNHCSSRRSSLDEVLESTHRVNLFANPVEEGNVVAPWFTARSKMLPAVQKIMGASAYTSKSGVSTWANAIFLVRIVDRQPDQSVLIENLHETGRRSVPRLQRTVESHLLFPALRGREISRWQHRSQFQVILPYERGVSDQPISQGDMERLYPLTYAYLKEVEDSLTSRSGYRRLRKGFPFYTIGNVTSDIFADFKVVWTKTGNEISCCVVGDREDRYLGRKVIIPLDSVTMVAFEKQEEAHFFCAIMNSTLLRVVLRTDVLHPTGGSVTKNILEHFGIPRFNALKTFHRELAELSLQAHRLVSLRQGEEADRPLERDKEGLFLKKIEEEIDKRTAGLWDFTEEDVVEMKRSLRELS